MRAVNLLPEVESGAAGAAAASRLSPEHGIAIVGIVVIAALTGVWGMARHDAASDRDAAAAATARTAAATAEVARLQPAVQLDALRTTRETAVQQLGGGRTDWSAVLRSVAGGLPKGVGITSLTAQGAGGTAAAASGGGTTAAPAGLGGSGSVSIVGCAPTQRSVATTLVRLRALPQVADVALQDASKAKKAATAGGGSTGSAECTGVTVNAAVGLSPAAALDAAGSSAKAAGAAGTTSGSATPTTGAAGAPATQAAVPSTGGSR